MSKAGQGQDKALVCLFVVEAVEKSPKDYQKKYCHDRMWRKNYKIADKPRVSRQLAAQLERGDAEAEDELKKILRRNGLVGKFRIFLNPGGPGRKRFGESKYERLSKPRPRQICRLSVDGEDDGEMDVFWD